MLINLRTYKRVEVDATPMCSVRHCKERIYSTMLKLSVAVHSSLAEILICQPCLHDIWRCHDNVIITSKSGKKLSSFLTFFFIAGAKRPLKRSSPELRHGSCFHATFWSFLRDLFFSSKTLLLFVCLYRKWNFPMIGSALSGHVTDHVHNCKIMCI